MSFTSWAEADSSNGLFMSLYLSVAEVSCHMDQFDNPSPPSSSQDIMRFLPTVADDHCKGCPCNTEKLLGQKETMSRGKEKSQEESCQLRDRTTVWELSRWNDTTIRGGALKLKAALRRTQTIETGCLILCAVKQSQQNTHVCLLEEKRGRLIF